MKKIYRGTLYKIWQYKLNYILHRKINRIYHNLERQGLINYDKDGLKEHLYFWKKIAPLNNSRWYKVYSSLSGINDKYFVPESIYYTEIEPRLNDLMTIMTYADKNIYSKLYPEELFPKTIFRNIHGVFYDQNYTVLHLDNQGFIKRLNPYTKLVTKKTMKSGGGRDVNVFEKKDDQFIDSNNTILSMVHLTGRYGRNFIVQEYIEQLEYFKKFNPSSVNTVRVFTYRSVLSGNIVPLHSVLRIGKKGEVVDNQASGGISRGIDESGKLNDYAVDKYGNIHKEYNSVVFREADLIPEFDRIIEYAVEVAQKNHYSRVLALDFCVDKDGSVKLLEINTANNEINFHQMNSGPIFGDYTEEIIDFCRNNPKTFCSGFYLD